MRLHCLLFIASIFVFSFTNAKNSVSIKTVVIDAGHGGKDPGASSKSGKIHEKDVALAVALKLGNYIEKNFPDVNVIYTRKTDVFLELHERAEIANKAKADLFIAIHCNASTNDEIYGTSSYVLGLHRTEANLEVAKRENAVILLEEDRDKNYEFDPNTPEGHIIMSMKQNAFLDQSIDFASKVETQFGNYSRRKSLGVKQAGFYVLYKTAMPSLLAEIGFISNPDEEKFLTSSKGQELVATGLFNAFKDYKSQMDGSSADVKSSPEEVKSAPEPVKETTTAEVKMEEPVTHNKPTPAPAPKTDSSPVAKTEKPDASTSPTKSVRKPIENSSGGGIAKTTAAAKVEVKPAPAKQNPPEAAPKDTAKDKPQKVPATKTETTTAAAEPKKNPEPKPETKTTTTVTKTETATSAVEPKKNPETKLETKSTPVPVAAKEKPANTEVKPKPGNSSSVPPHVAESGTVYKVQLFALKGEMKEYGKVSKLFDVLCGEELSNGFTRYYAGNLKSYAGAKKLLAVALENGYKDAFVIGFKDGKRMSTDQMNALDK